MTILYSMCWEDPEILRGALEINPEDNVLSIVSGGENIISLLLDKPRKITGIDVNFEQIYLTKLKIEAIKVLDFEEFIEFVGLKKSKNRLRFFRRINLEKKEKDYWGKNLEKISYGILHCGKFERYLKGFRRYFLPLIITRKNINRFLKLRSLKEQEEFYRRYFNNWRYRIIIRLLFSKRNLKRGREKSYFKYNKRKDIASYYLKRLEYGFTRVPIEDNFFMQYILTQKISTKNHPYLNKDKFMELKKLLQNTKIEFVCEDLLSFLNSSPEKFSKYNLSDVFEVYSQKEYEEIFEKIVKNSVPKAKICYWNHLAKRDVHFIRGLKRDSEKSLRLYKKDRVHFYSNFLIETTEN